MFIGVEIGGTKLQIGVGDVDGNPVGDVQRLKVEPAKGAAGIRSQLTDVLPQTFATLGGRHLIHGLGVGFGGPVDSARGRTITSHQIGGWGDFALVDWFESTFGVPTVLGNDSDLAGLAEAKCGAGRGAKTVVYSNIGSGIGGAFVRDGELYTGQGIGAAEVGHLRIMPGESGKPWKTLEETASGWALDRIARGLLGDASATAADLAHAARSGNLAAAQAWKQAIELWGVALANVATLLCPDRVVLGGGVALQGDFVLDPLRSVFSRNIFPPFAGRCGLVLAELGETMVVQGALLLAAGMAKKS